MQQKLRIITRSPDATRLMGETIGRYINDKTVIALSGDLGSGKTVFTQGIARGLDVSGDHPITSPTYTLINEYPGRLQLFHVDLYRISNAYGLDDTGFEEILGQNNVIVVEWADRLPPGELQEDISVNITIMDDISRRFHIFFSRRNTTDLIQQLKTGFIKDKE